MNFVPDVVDIAVEPIAGIEALNEFGHFVSLRHARPRARTSPAMTTALFAESKKLLINQPAVQWRQELVVENIGGLRPLLKLEVFPDLIDRALEARRVDRADAVAFHFAGQDVVAQDALQAFEFEVL
jgi:hypothetical protein